jgi:hypothetical protein
MPSVKDFEKRSKKPRRRPGREKAASSNDHDADIAEDEVQAAFGFEETNEFQNQSEEEAAESRKVHIEFPYSSLVRAKVPKVFEVAESVATDWVNDGSFENVPVGHPVAQMTVAAGLRKAKEVEKKLEEKGVFMMAKMGLAYAKSKLKR